MFDFPNAPTVGAIYSPAGGPSWQWDGAKWIQVTGSTSPPVPLTAESRNRIVNGAMQISQELAKGTDYSTNASYPADQWMSAVISAPLVQNAGNQLRATPFGSPWSLHVYPNVGKASLAAGDYAQLFQQIEGIRVADFGWGTAAAKLVVLRFNWMATIAGTFAVRLTNGAATRSYVKNFTISAGQVNVWQTITMAIPGDTSGVWAVDNSVSIILGFCFGAGSTYIAPAEGWNAGVFLAGPGITNNVSTTHSGCWLGDVGLYLDKNNTGLPPPWQMPDEAQELAACMRYYQQLSNTIVNSATSAYALMLRATMRSNPAVTGGGTGFTLGNVTPYSISIFQTAQAYQNLVANARM